MLGPFANAARHEPGFGGGAAPAKPVGWRARLWRLLAPVAYRADARAEKPRDRMAACGAQSRSPRTARSDAAGAADRLGGWSTGGRARLTDTGRFRPSEREPRRRGPSSASSRYHRD